MAYTCFGGPSDEVLKRLRNKYKTGTRVELIQMNDPYRYLAPGLQGSVAHVDDMGTIFVNWDNGSTLGVVYGVDLIKEV